MLYRIFARERKREHARALIYAGNRISTSVLAPALSPYTHTHTHTHTRGRKCGGLRVKRICASMSRQLSRIDTRFVDGQFAVRVAKIFASFLDNETGRARARQPPFRPATEIPEDGKRSRVKLLHQISIKFRYLWLGVARRDGSFLQCS